MLKNSYFKKLYLFEKYVGYINLRKIKFLKLTVKDYIYFTFGTAFDLFRLKIL